MKNAYVTEDHFGDDGSVTVGMILTGVTAKRFNELEDKGLVREATAQEVEEGYKPAFESEADASKARIEGIDLSDPANSAARQVAEEAQKFMNQLREDHDKALDAERDRADAAEKALEDALAEIETMKTAAAEADKALTSARAEADELKAAAAKQAQPPANKKAAEPANKGA
jgi:hypothetical protein